MKKTLLSFLLLSGLAASAQTPLPYNSGFDNSTEQAGWQGVRKGHLSTYTWTYSSFNPFSSPNKLDHDYPVGGNAADTVMDWFVSPPFNLSNGGKLAFKAIAYAIMGSNMPEDRFSVYLLNGSDDPATASLTLLLDMRPWVSSSTNWRDTSGVNIPAVPGTSYIAFYYQATQNWWVPSVDDVSVTANPVGLTNEAPSEKAFLYPNPAGSATVLQVQQVQAQTARLMLTDLSGRVVQDTEVNLETGHNALPINLQELPEGTYCLSLTTTQGVQHFKILKSGV